MLVSLDNVSDDIVSNCKTKKWVLHINSLVSSKAFDFLSQYMTVQLALCGILIIGKDHVEKIMSQSGPGESQSSAREASDFTFNNNNDNKPVIAHCFVLASTWPQCNFLVLPGQVFVTDVYGRYQQVSLIKMDGYEGAMRDLRWENFNCFQRMWKAPYFNGPSQQSLFRPFSL